MKFTLPPAQSKTEACSSAGLPGPSPGWNHCSRVPASGFCFGVPSLFFHLYFLLADLSSVTPAVLNGHHSHDLPLTFSPSPQAAFAKGAGPEVQPIVHFVAKPSAKDPSSSQLKPYARLIAVSPQLTSPRQKTRGHSNSAQGPVIL